MFLKTEDISKTYGNQVVLSTINFEIEKGSTAAIVGPSGSGKTTFLNIIGTLDKADSGKVWFNNQDINLFNDLEKSVFRNQNIGFVFQQHYLLPQCTVLENVMMPLIMTNNKDERVKALKRAKELLAILKMSDNCEKFPGQLSGGECQRTSFVRALIRQPQLILADEPTGSLDEENADALVSELINLNKELNTTLITVTHSTTLAAKMQSRWYMKNHGLIAENGLK